MSNLPQPVPVDRFVENPSAAIPVVDSATLMKGERLLLIRHGSSLYRLRVTASDKLILTK